MMRHACLCCLSFAVLQAPSPAEGADELMLELTLGNRTLTGLPLEWAANEALLLQRDGQIVSIPTRQARGVRRASERFSAVDGREMRGLLQREFGPAMEVSAAGQYVVAHPKGSRQPWAQQFDQLYRNFLHYFHSRGVSTAKPRFPMVAIVFPNQREFLNYARRDGAKIPPGCIGYYSNFTNRVVQFDQGRGGPSNLALIIHEASHQVAFNTGVHHRGSPPPRWLSEGLGTMFEARGVWNAGAHRARRDRLNARQLEAFRRWAAVRPPGSLPQFVSNDRLFADNLAAAYAESWALSFFLAETDPRRWADYLRITSDVRRKPKLRDPERLQEFVRAFGPDLNMLEARYLRFMAEL